MLENQTLYNRTLDTTDCLKAVSVFKKWQTMMLLLITICLLLLQASFYLADQAYIKINERIQDNGPILSSQSEGANSILQYLVKWLPKESISKITFDNLSWTINLVNAVLILAAFLYCLTLHLNLKISIVGRLGGMKHITRACMLSLLIIILLLPWQKMFNGVVLGAVFTPKEMVKWYSVKTEGMLNSGLYYLRFGGYGLSVFLLLIFSELASLLWYRAVQRRIRVKEAEIQWGL